MHNESVLVGPKTCENTLKSSFSSTWVRKGVPACERLKQNTAWSTAPIVWWPSVKDSPGCIKSVLLRGKLFLNTHTSWAHGEEIRLDQGCTLCPHVLQFWHLQTAQSKGQWLGWAHILQRFECVQHHAVIPTAASHLGALPTSCKREISWGCVFSWDFIVISLKWPQLWCTVVPSGGGVRIYQFCFLSRLFTLSSLVFSSPCCCRRCSLFYLYCILSMSVKHFKRAWAKGCVGSIQWGACRVCKKLGLSSWWDKELLTTHAARAHRIGVQAVDGMYRESAPSLHVDFITSQSLPTMPGIQREPRFPRWNQSGCLSMFEALQKVWCFWCSTVVLWDRLLLSKMFSVWHISDDRRCQL